MSDIPTLRWGIVATGLISSWFVADLIIDRPDKKANHVIQAIGSSSCQKGKDFVSQHLPGQDPTVYEGYDAVYKDENVDIVYIGTPHAFHKQNTIDAIRAGKHVLCEKPFTMTQKEAKAVFEEAEKHGVFVMEAMWTRFFPLVKKLRHLVHEEKVIGDVHRAFCDFSMRVNIHTLPPTSRLKDPALGAGVLMDIGVYSLTWILVALEAENAQETPIIKAAQRLSDGVDVATSIIVSYSDGRQGIATCSAFTKTPINFCRIEGSKGTIVVEGLAAPIPTSFRIDVPETEREPVVFERPGRGFYFEADAVALDIAAGKKQSDIMPWEETVRVMGLLDEARRQGGGKFPQDDE